MSCKLSYDLDKQATKATNSETGIYLYIPKQDKWEYIRFRVRQGDRLADAYDKADASDLLPPEYLIPSIKAIYQTTDIEQYTRQRIDKPYGNGMWILEAFCDVLKNVNEAGRYDLGDGFILPNQGELECINNLLYQQGKTLAAAYRSCCSDIIPPDVTLSYIESSLRTTTAPLFDILRSARVMYIAGFFNVSQTPADNSRPDNEIGGIKTKYLFLGLLAILAIRLLKGNQDGK